MRSPRRLSPPGRTDEQRRGASVKVPEWRSPHRSDAPAPNSHRVPHQQPPRVNPAVFGVYLPGWRQRISASRSRKSTPGTARGRVAPADPGLHPPTFPARRRGPFRRRHWTRQVPAPYSATTAGSNAAPGRPAPQSTQPGSARPSIRRRCALESGPRQVMLARLTT